MGWPGGSLVTSLYRRCGVERSWLPERIGRRSVEHIFGRRKNDYSWKSIRDPAWNASYILRGAQGSWPLTLGAGLGGPTWLRLFEQGQRDATCPIEGCLEGSRQPATWSLRGGLYSVYEISFLIIKKISSYKKPISRLIKKFNTNINLSKKKLISISENKKK